MSWRRFQTLTAGLYGIEGSIWVWLQQDHQDEWSPSNPAAGRIVKGEQAQAVFASWTAGAKRSEGPVNL